MEACQIDLKCNFYKVCSVCELNKNVKIISLFQHYPSLEGRPEQCFFFDTCGKLVSRLLFYTADLHLMTVVNYKSVDLYLITIVKCKSADLHFNTADLHLITFL